MRGKSKPSLAGSVSLNELDEGLLRFLTEKERNYILPRLRKLAKLKAEDNLEDFVRGAWHVLEPNTKLDWSWHLSLICEHLKLIRDNKFREVFGENVEGLIVNVPPRTMKSLLITVFFPAWVWATQPGRRFMSVSYSEKLSTQHSVYRRNVIDSPWYQNNWKDKFRFAKDQNLKTHYENTQKGQMFSTAMHATATGMGGDILIFDDPLNPDQSLSEVERESVNVRFDNTFRTRINDFRVGMKIVVMQRLHETDLTGYILGKEKDRWVHLKLAATAEKDEKWDFPITGAVKERRFGELLWPDRMPKAFLDGQTVGLGTWTYAGQYQQNPAPLEGGLIKRSWVKFYQELPASFEILVQSWDCTFKDSAESDFVAGQVWARSAGRYYMLPYRVNARMDFGPTLKAVEAMCKDVPGANAILIEDKANGSAIISELRQRVPGVLAVEPYGGKLSRAQGMAPSWESGSVLLPDPEIFDVPWIEDYLHNICTFPKAAHDDDVDATSQAINWMRVNSFGLLEVWKQQAEAAKQKAADEKAGPPPVRTEQEVSRELGTAQLDAASLQRPSAETMKALGATPTAGKIAHAESLGLMPPKKPPEKKGGCPKCGNMNLAKYGDYSECAPCGWNSRMIHCDYLVEVGNPAQLEETLKQIPKVLAVMPGAPNYQTQDGLYVVRVYDGAVLFEFACNEQGYCKIIKRL